MRPARAALVLLLVVALGTLTATAVGDSAPPGATARCRDGTYSFSRHHSGTCSYHGGVAEWLDSSSSAGGSSGGSAGGSTFSTCGVERWVVKTLQDRPRLLSVQATTIAHLVGLPAPHPLPTTRLPFERHVFRVTAAVTLDRPEADGDLHLVLSDGTRTMIAETPSPSCTVRATPTRRRQMAQARSQASLCSRARVTGVAFFDFKHGQTGVAPNAIELHPVLAFRCLS